MACAFDDEPASPSAEGGEVGVALHAREDLARLATPRADLDQATLTAAGSDERSNDAVPEEAGPAGSTGPP